MGTVGPPRARSGGVSIWGGAAVYLARNGHLATVSFVDVL